jgi:23S rRNA pseudouridine2605 synthase
LKEFSRKRVVVKKTKTPEDQAEITDLIRLNKYISNAGVCSRRDADKIISEGLITVNGNVITELGFKVALKDDVCYQGRKLNPERKVYLLLNKPRGFVTTVDDPHASRTVMQLVENACSERIYPVGRLDTQTTGLLLFTNDGELAKKLTHPSYEREKIYHVQLDKDLMDSDVEKIKHGIELEDGFIAADDIQLIDPSDRRQVGIEIHSGKNRIVRRIFNHLGYNVDKLDRVMFAGLTKKDLPRGRYRFLTSQEVNFLKMS